MDSRPAPENVNPVEQASSSVIALLARKKRGRDSEVHPEVRKVLERILDRLCALGSDDGGDNEARAEGLGLILREHAWLETARPKDPPSEEQAWALADALQAVWIRTAGPDAIAEVVRRTTDPSPPDNLTTGGTQEWLLANYIERQRTGAHSRARGALRARYLKMAGLMLTLLVLAATCVGLVVSNDRWVIVLCGLAGAIGGTLTGARSIRDTRKMREALFFQTWWWVQPAVGFAVGLFIYALLESGVLVLPGSESSDADRQSAARVVYAFVAGFSEPWLLGIIGRLGGAADKAASATTNTRNTNSDGQPPPE